MALPVTLTSFGGYPVSLVDERFTNYKVSVPIILASLAVPVSITGTTAETILATVAIPAGIMGLNGALRINSQWSTPGGSGNNKTIRTRFGGISGTTVFGLVVTTTLSYNDYSRIVRNRNSASSQVTRDSGNSSAAASKTLSVNTAIAQDLVFTAQLASAGETITLEEYTVELLLP